MTKFNLFGMLVLVMALTLVGGCCGGGGSSSTDSGDSGGSSGGGKFAKSCNDHDVLSTCSEYTKDSMELLGEDFYKGICELTNGKWTTDPCPTANVIGKCDDGDGAMTYYYSDGESVYDKETAQQACKDMLGTFKE